MNPDLLRDLLARLEAGQISVPQAERALAELPFQDLDFARIDHHRPLRQGLPEVIFAQEKTAAQIMTIAREIMRQEVSLLITRLSAEKASEVCASLEIQYDAVARAAYRFVVASPRSLPGAILVVTGGTSDLPVAAEARLTLELCGLHSELIQDVGVAGLQRLLAELPRLRQASAVIVIAGMEGALASVVGGLVACPVIAVPTSVGYGAAFDGLAALLGMMTSCAAGITVVNIDNGFGAAVAVARMMELLRSATPSEGTLGAHA